MDKCGSRKSLFSLPVDEVNTDKKLPKLTLNYMGERLNIDPAIVDRGFRLIAIKATPGSTANARLLQPRNSYNNMKEPDVAKLLKKKLVPLFEEEKELNTVINQQIYQTKTHSDIKRAMQQNKIH